MNGEIVFRIKADGRTEIRVFADSVEDRDFLFQKLEKALPGIEFLEVLLKGPLNSEAPSGQSESCISTK